MPGLETPLLYSTQALELNQTRTKMLIESYFESMTTGSSFGRTNRDAFFEQELPYAKPHELAWFLRWALSRVVRVNDVTGEELHGLFEWGVYEEWRGRERGESDRCGTSTEDLIHFLSLWLPA